jgi:hypothetical protein
MLFLYIFFYLFALQAERLKEPAKRNVLIFVCIVLTLMAGFRNPLHWADTDAYIYSFNVFTNPLTEWSRSDSPMVYSEYGFYFLGVIYKTFSTNVTGYLTFIAALSFIFMYKCFRKYCYYPLFGVCAYIARFYTARNFVQIRAGLSYAIVLWAVQYITKRDWKRYFLWILIAYQIHHSAILAVPLYFLCLVKVKRWHILLGIFVAFIIGGIFTEPMRELVSGYVTDMNVATTYLGKNFQREWGLGNPVIYFQLAILLIYTLNESVLKNTSEDYYTMRTAYFYSTFILISCSMYTALSGRTSSMYATLEMAIIPTIINTFYKKNQWLAYVGLGVVLSAIFYMNEYR